MTEPNPICEHCSALAAERDELSLENERLMNAVVQLTDRLCIDQLKVEILEARLAEAKAEIEEHAQQLEWARRGVE